MSHSLDPRIFRAYDIRGQAHEQLSTDACRLIARAFGEHCATQTNGRSPVLCVGRDARTHGPALEEAVIEGLVQAGCTVLRIGQTPSPVNYFTVCTQELDGGIQVTASHNPAADNGLKLCTAHAHAFAGEDIQSLRTSIERDEWRYTGPPGTVEEIDAITPYVTHLAGMFGNVCAGLSVGVDSGNGVAGPLYCAVLRSAGARVVDLYTEPDGTFPNHPADPSRVETLRDLQALVLEQHLDMGLAFDGDGDRVGLIDEQGAIRSADELLLLLAEDHLSRNKGAPVVFTVSNSAILPLQIQEWGGVPVLCKVGHSFVEHAMLEHGAQLGGEQSGHFFCAEGYYAFDDALVAALHVASLRQRANQPLSQMLSVFPRVYQSPEYRPKVADEEKGRIIEDLAVHFSQTHDVLTIDGVRIDFDDGAWVGIRQSNTSPCISICMEARSPERLQELEEMILEKLRTYPEIEWE